MRWSGTCALRDPRGAPCPPSLELRVMLGPGSGAGIFWTVANVCATLAVLRGGQATTIATINCFSLITSGLWGLLWYRELKGRPAVACAVAAAIPPTHARDHQRIGP